MALNSEQIKGLKLVEPTLKDRLFPASYDMTIGTFVDSKGNEHEEFDLGPQQMVTVISEERMTMNEDVIGYATPVTTLHLKGVLSLATGIIDPGYEGLISTTLINFSTEPNHLKKGDEFLRISFHFIEELQDKSVIDKVRNEFTVSDQEYRSLRRAAARRFPDTFLNITEAADKAAQARYQRLDQMITRYALVFGLIPIVLAIVAFLAAPMVNEMTADAISEKAAARLEQEEIEPVEVRVTELENKLITLREQQAETARQADSRSR